MNTIAWNCRGIGLPATIKTFQDHIFRNRPFFIFLCETRSGYAKSLDICRQFTGFDCFVVPSRGFSGGLWCLWDNTLDFTVEFSDDWIIHGKFTDGEQCNYFSGIYFNSKPNIRHVQWSFLPNIRPPDNCPWICIGDFKANMCPEEKWGGKAFDWNQTNKFNSLVFDYCLMDLGFVGNIFTWSNKQHGTKTILARLDRALVNSAWQCKFPHAKLYHIPTLHSDHKILWLNYDTSSMNLSKPFRFETMWLMDPDCKQVVSNAVQKAYFRSPFYVLCRRLGLCKNRLRVWNRDHFGNLKRKAQSFYSKIIKVQERLNDLSLDPFQLDNLINEEIDLLQEYEKVLQQKNLHCGQKARMDNLHLWEQNTHFSHSTVVKRRRRNFIGRLITPDHEELTSRDDIGAHLQHHLHHMLSSEPHERSDEFLAPIPQLVTMEDNDNLMAPVSNEEIQAALKSIASYKSHGPDGFQAIFYKHFWEEIRPTVNNDQILL